MIFDSPTLIGNPIETAVDLGNVTGAKTVDLALSSYYTGTITGNTTWTFSSSVAGLRGSLLKLTNAGAFTHAYASNVKFAGGIQPVFTAAGIDFVSVFTDGTNVYLSLAIKDAK